MAEAESIDGMLMATQYEISWREDLELGVVIPFQNIPWCMHDYGCSKLTHYDEARRKVLAEYRDFFSDFFRRCRMLCSKYWRNRFFYN